MEVFINGTGIISPQPSFDENAFSLDSLKIGDSDRLTCIEPEYKNYINPSLSRRMSRMIKMGITASKICLENAGVAQPGAIITGTGLGCIEDTEKFIQSIIENNETLLTPTPFIQSTHNTVGGQIALLLGCHEYNFTYTHRGISFESALLDAALLIQEKSADDILVGGMDELTNNSFKLLQQLGFYTTAAAAGEGASFFLLSGKKTEKSIAKISAVKTFVGKMNEQFVSEKIVSTLSESGKTLQQIDLILLGDSGNTSSDFIYNQLRNGILKNSNTKTYKPFCGEYHTASAFAMWLSTKFISKKNNSSVLLYNHFGGVDHSIILIEKC